MSAYTPPKGKPTLRRSEQDAELRRANRRATVEWAAVTVVGLLIVVGLFFVFGDIGSDGVTGPVGGHG